MYEQVRPHIAQIQGVEMLTLIGSMCGQAIWKRNSERWSRGIFKEYLLHYMPLSEVIS